MKFFWSNKTTPKDQPARNIRDTLFGDSPLHQWTADREGSQDVPWNLFNASRKDLLNDKQADAIKKWAEIVELPNLEPRHYLQAWHFLRMTGQNPPPDIAKQVLGVVVEVGLETGLDLLAAYPDYSARYYNYSGAGIVWEHPDDSMNQAINSLLNAANRVVAQIGPWEGERPPAPPAGQVRLCFLTPSGLHFGQAPMKSMVSNPLGGEVLHCATMLMKALIDFRQRKAN